MDKGCKRCDAGFDAIFNGAIKCFAICLNGNIFVKTASLIRGFCSGNYVSHNENSHLPC